MKRLLSLKIAIVLLLVVLLFPDSIQAQVTCDQQPDVSGPWFSYPLKDKTKRENDCGIVQPGTLAWDEFVKTATCTQIPATQALLNLVGEPSLLQRLLGQNPELEGQVTLQSDTVGNYALGNSVYENSNPAQVEQASYAVSYFDNINPARFVDTCYADPTLDPSSPTFLKDCAVKTGFTINLPSGPQTNVLATSNEYERSTTLPDQLKLQCQTAQTYADCAADPLSHPDCATFNRVKSSTDPSTPREIDIANDILKYLPCGESNQSLFSTYNALSSEKQNIINSLRPPAAAAPYAIVFIRKDSTSIGSWFDYILSDSTKNPSNLWGWGNLPRIKGTAQGFIRYYQKKSNLSEGQRVIAEVTKPRSDDVPKAATAAQVYDQLVKKIELSKSSCSNLAAPIQHAGSVAETFGSDSIPIFSFLLKFSQEKNDQSSDTLDLYDAYLLQPAEANVIQQLGGLNPNSKNRIFGPLSQSDQFSRTDVPSSFNSTGLNSTWGTNIPTGDPIPCTLTGGTCQCPSGYTPIGDGNCQKTQEGGFSLTGGAPKDGLNFNGGEQTQFSLLSSVYRRFKVLKDGIQDPCYFRGLNAASGNVLATLLQVSEQYLGNTSCPDPFANTSVTGNYSCPDDVKASIDKGAIAWWGNQVSGTPPSFSGPYGPEYYRWVAQTYDSNLHHDSNILPNSQAVGCVMYYFKNQKIDNSNLNAANVNAIIEFSQKHQWNPAFLIAVWLEESLAGSAENNIYEFGCDEPENNSPDVNSQLNCINTLNYAPFHFGGPGPSGDAAFLCSYAGDCLTNNTQTTNTPFPAALWFYNYLILPPKP